jgi:hypothetical protein
MYMCNSVWHTPFVSSYQTLHCCMCHCFDKTVWNQNLSSVESYTWQTVPPAGQVLSVPFESPIKSLLDNYWCFRCGGSAWHGRTDIAMPTNFGETPKNNLCRTRSNTRKSKQVRSFFFAVCFYIEYCNDDIRTPWFSRVLYAASSCIK